MAQVPYSPVPDVTSTYAPTPEIHLNTPDAAFGGAVGAALSHLGQVTDKASDEIFARAQAMQALNNETQAREKMIDFTTQSDKLTADFKTKLNQDAGPAAYDQYQKDILTLRDQARKGLTNPDSQKMFDAQAGSQTTNALKWGAFHSAEQLKQYASTSNKMAIESNRNQILANPQDEALYNTKMSDIADHATNDGHLHGLNDDQIKLEIQKEQSAATKDRIQGFLNNGDVTSARRALDDHKDKLVGPDAGLIQKQVNSYENIHGSRQVVDGLKDGSSLGMGTGIVPIERARDAIGSVESSNNYDLFHGKFVHQGGALKGQEDEALGRYGILQSNLPRWLKAAGLPNMTPQEFVANHDAQDKVFDTQYGAMMKTHGSFNGAADEWLGPGKADTNGTTHSAYLAKANVALYAKAPLADRLTSAQEQGKKLSPDNVELPDHIESHVVAETSLEQREKRLAADTDQYNINNAIQEQFGKGPLTVDALRANEGFRKVYDAMAPNDQNDLRNSLARRAKTDYNTDPERDSNFDRLHGLAWVDPEEFRRADLGKENLNAPQMSKLLGLQKQVLGSGGTLKDPAMQYVVANQSIKDIAYNGGIDTEGKDKTEWHKFVGAVSQDILFARAEGKNLTPKDIEEIAKKAALPREGTGFWGFGQSKEYQIPLHSVPENEQARMRQSFERQGNHNPSDQEMTRLYAKKLYLDSLKSGGI